MKDESPIINESVSIADGASLGAKVVRFSIIGTFLILLVSALYFAESLLLPITLGFLFALIFSPIVRWARRRGLPEALTAFLLVMVIGGSFIGGAYFLSDPVSQWMQDMPRIGSELQRKLIALRKPVETLKETERQVEKATSQEPDSDVQQVIVKEPGFLSQMAQGAPGMLTGAGLTLVLLLFLLASGDMFIEKIVRVLPTFSDKKRGLRIARDIEREVSRYLFTITVINAILGFLIAVAFFAIGMPNPILWGIAASLLNFIPYVGAIIGIILAAAISIISFPGLGQAVLAPAIYLTISSIEGQIATPAFVGRRLQINGVSVILAVAFWGWIWGFAGIFIAVPVLIVIKVFSLHIDELSSLHEFLSPRNSELTGEE